MPGAKSKQITADIKTIQNLQERISAWGSKMAGFKEEKAWKTLLEHVTGVGHLEIFKLAEYQKLDLKSAKMKLERGTTALNNAMVALHTGRARQILMKDTLEEQEQGVKAYADAMILAMKKFKEEFAIGKKTGNPWPTDVKAAYTAVKNLGTAKAKAVKL